MRQGKINILNYEYFYRVNFPQYYVMKYVDGNRGRKSFRKLKEDMLYKMSRNNTSSKNGVSFKAKDDL